MKPIAITRTKHGFSVRIRCGKGRNPRFTIALQDETAAQRRAQGMAELARMLVAAGGGDDAQEALKEAGEQTTDVALESMLARTASKLAAGTRIERKPAAAEVTFQQLAERWTGGQLAREFPDHVKVKATSEYDRMRLSKLYSAIGGIPLREFTVVDAKRGMTAIPEGRLPNTRRQYAQLISRVLALAAWPCELIARSPLPRGFLPKTGKRPSFAYLYPAEEAKLIACATVPFESRVLYGVLAREGMRLGEARRLLWRDIDLENGTLRLDTSKNGEARAWALNESVARVLRVLGTGQSSDALVFEGVARKAAKLFRDHLKLAGIDRPELFERTLHRRPIRIHDLRATFITVSLDNNCTETWVADRTGHRSSQMINGYRRRARTSAQVGLGPLQRLHECLPEFRPEPEGVNQRVNHDAEPSSRTEVESSTVSDLCAREGSNLHALRRWNLKPDPNDGDKENADGNAQADRTKPHKGAAEAIPAQGGCAANAATDHLVAALTAAAQAGDMALVRSLADLLEARTPPPGPRGNVIDLDDHRGKRRPQ